MLELRVMSECLICIREGISITLKAGTLFSSRHLRDHIRACEVKDYIRACGARLRTILGHVV